MEQSFALTLLEVLAPHLPSSEGLSAADLAAPVALKPPAAPVDLELNAREAFLDSVPEVVASLADALAPVDPRNPEYLPAAAHGALTAPAATVPPRKSKQQLAAEGRAKAQQLQAGLEELLAVTSDMPVEDYPLSQGEIVAELVAAGVLEPLVACLAMQQTPETRLQAAGAAIFHKQACNVSLLRGELRHHCKTLRLHVDHLQCVKLEWQDGLEQPCSSVCIPVAQGCWLRAELLERFVRVQPPNADTLARLQAVPACTRALLAPEDAVKVKAFNLKSSAAAADGADTFTPKLRAARLLKALVVHSEVARTQLAKPPAGEQQLLSAL